MNIGEKIKTIRLSKRLTQQELADRCELSKGYISQLENNITSPSISTLEDILLSLGSDLNHFFQAETNKKVVFTQEDYFEKYDEQFNYRIKWLITDAQRNFMEPILLILDENGKFIEDEPHEGEEFGFVIEGKISLHISDRITTVHQGESFYYESVENHTIKNINNGTTKILFVSSPPSF